MKILDSYKKIAKEFITESAWDRKFGEPLPTLQDVMNEVDDDKIIKYKKKDGEQGEMKASSAKTMPDDHPAKQVYNKMKGDDSGEKDSSGKLGGGDFDRDANRAADDEADDMDRDARFDADAEDDEEDDDDYNSKITARNNPHSADAFFSNPYETIQINGKKYRPIKESKKEKKTFTEKVKENSKRFDRK